MPRVLPLLLLSLLVSLLPAQAPILDPVAEARKALAYDPLNDAIRLNLAWNLMLSEQYDDALREYRLVASRDSSSVDAAAGILWALNSQGRYIDAISEADLMLRRIEDQAAVYYHRGLAKLNLGRANSARLDQSRSLRLAGDTLWKELAAKALSDSYLALDDLPEARAVLARHSPEVDKPKGIKALLIDVTWGRKGESTDLFSLGLKALMGQTRLSFQAEELLLDQSHFRWDLHALVLRQFRHLEVQAALRLMDGEDERLYPAKGAGIAVMPKLYAGPLVLRPRLAQNLLVTKRLNSYQSDLGFQLRLPRIAVSYGLAYVYLDREIVDSDTSDLVHNADLTLALGKGFEAGVYAASGKLAFSSTPYGGVIDEFEPADGFTGLSFYAPITKRLGILVYGQLSFQTDASTAFYYLRGSYRV